MKNDFTDLDIYKLSEDLVVFIYGITTDYPEEEKYSIISQMRRAVTSIGANIAEGYGRYHFKEKIQFCRHARGSLEELKHFILCSKNLGYITEKTQETFLRKHKDLKVRINNFIRSIDNKI